MWPAYGIALAAVLFCGHRIWPAVASAAFVIAFLSPESFLTALGQAAGTTLAALTGLFLLRRLAKFDNSISRLRDVLALVLFGGVVSAMVSASIGTIVLHASDVHTYSGFAPSWLIYWLGDCTGVLLVTPLVLTIPNFNRVRRWGRTAEFCCLLLVLIGACTIVFDDLPIVPVRMVAFAILPLIIWAAIRFGVSGAAFSMFIVATVATVDTALGAGSFASSSPFINGVQLDLFFTVLSLTGLTLATLYSERERAELGRVRSMRAQVAMEFRLQNQEILRVSEERLRLAQQAARIGTFERNLRTGLVTWTQELEQMYGLPPGSFVGTTTAFFENLIHSDDRERVTELSNQAIKTRQPTAGEWRAIWSDGSVHWIAGWWQVFLDECGDPARVIGVNTDVTERKLTEKRLREYERAVEGVEELILVVDREYRCLMANREFLKMRNLTSDQVVGRFVQEVVDKEVYKAVVRPKLDECFQGKVIRHELKYTYPHIGERDLLASYYPIEGKQGVDRAACILQDITDRKHSEHALAGMTRKLIDAQEQERTRIGRELHDDINQRLAMISLDLQQLQEDPSELQRRMQEVRKRMNEISSDVQALSHDLHSTKLEYLGVAAGIKSWCKDFAERQKIEIDFKADVSSVLLPEVGVSLFRVLQEALNNAMKHSGVKRIEVQLSEYANAVHLIVMDKGVGFDVEAAMHGRGLGLTSMRERVRLINGTIAIESYAIGGTTIHVRVPTESKDCAQRAAV